MEKSRFEITTQLKTNNLEYLIDLILRNFNKLLLQLFNAVANYNNEFPEIIYFDKYCMLLVKIKDFNHPFLDQPVKNKQEAYEKLFKMSRNNNHTKRNLLH